MFRRLFLFFLVFLGIGPRVWAEGIIPVICTTEQFKGCKNISHIYEYNWNDWPNNPERDFSQPMKNPIKVYTSDGYIVKEYNWDDWPNNPERDFSQPMRNPIKIFSIDPINR